MTPTRPAPARRPARLPSPAAHRGAGAAVATVLLALLLVAGPLAEVAGAVPARPVNYRSEVTEVDPPVEGLAVRIIGGDQLLEVVAPPGVVVVALGYGEEPYLRIGDGGRVLVNVNSPAHYLNDERLGRVPLPDHADEEAEPSWKRLADGRSWAWHDHRVHWMMEREPPVVREAGGEAVRVMDWEVPLLVDGEPVVVRGTLDWEPDVVPVMPLAAALLVAGAVALLALRRARVGPLAGAVLAGAGALATAVAAGEALVSPRYTWDVALQLSLALPAVGFLAGIAVLALARAQPAWARTAGLVATAVLVGWTAFHLPALTAPVVPTELPVGLARTGVATTGLVALTAGVALALRPRAV